MTDINKLQELADFLGQQIEKLNKVREELHKDIAYELAKLPQPEDYNKETIAGIKFPDLPF